MIGIYMKYVSGLLCHENMDSTLNPLNLSAQPDAASGEVRLTREHLEGGPLRRALELALDGLGVSRTKGIAAGDAASTLTELGASLSSSLDIVARPRTPPVGQLRALGLAGFGVLAPVSEGWLVVGRGRAVLVGAGGERSVPMREGALARVAGRGRLDALVLEPRFALESLTARHRQRTSASPRLSPWTRLWALMQLERRELFSLVLYALFLGALSLALPVAVQVVVNTIAFGSLLQPLVVLSLLLFGVLLLTGVVQVLEWFLVELLQRRLFVRVAEDFARRLAAVPYGEATRRNLPELVNRFFEVAPMQKTVGKLLVDGLGLVLQTLTGLVLLAFYHPLLLAFDLVLVLGLGAVTLLGIGAIESARAESVAKYRVGAWLEAIAGNSPAFKRRGGSLLAAHRADVLTRSYLAERSHHYRWVLRQLVGGVVVQVLAMVALLGVGGYLVMRGELTLGQLVAAELVIGTVAAGFAKLGRHFEAVYDLLAGVDKVGAVLDLPTEARGDCHGTQGAPALQLERLQAPAQGACGQLTGRIPAGHAARIEGGELGEVAGLLEVLAGLREPSAGRLLVDRRERSELPEGSLRERAFLLRGDDVVAGSVLDNLRMGDPGLSREEALAALEQVGLRSRITRLPEGLDSPLLPSGSPLSPHEVPRLTVARALVARPDLILVDRALDGLAHETAQALWTALRSGLACTLVLHTRQPQLAELCDEALVVEGQAPRPRQESDHG